ncbi:hypothetical protein RHSIM_Rhsim03G0039100 [Rhododendron simsii]|uniref:Uncharacterized protein n=1 Tax=Rhododendron simsii TaxID=118357 RepID=A0A834H5F5_RHOSS|nr:hypothetical protein RHSIM_Rhsim03G0039100 [Rhododendron simsii]
MLPYSCPIPIPLDRRTSAKSSPPMEYFLIFGLEEDRTLRTTTIGGWLCSPGLHNSVNLYVYESFTYVFLERRMKAERGAVDWVVMTMVEGLGNVAVMGWWQICFRYCSLQDMPEVFVSRTYGKGLQRCTLFQV